MLGLLHSLARYVRVLGVTKNLREAIRWLLLAEEKSYDDVPDTMNDIIGESAAALLPILTEKAEEGTHHFFSFLFFLIIYYFYKSGSALGQYYLSQVYTRLTPPVRSPPPPKPALALW